MEIKHITGNYAFTRNPIVIAHDFSSVPFDRNGGRLTVSVGDRVVYRARFSSPLNLDVSEIVDAAIEPFFIQDVDNGNFLRILCNANGLDARTATVKAVYGDTVEEISFLPILGGVSNQNFKRYAAAGRDAFHSRFINTQANYFLTTRTSGWRIVLKETELSPLCFIKHAAGSLSFADNISHSTVEVNQLGRGIYALDLNALRLRFMSDHNVLPNSFDVYTDGVYSCSIVIEQADFTTERYRLTFRNSLGVHETVEICGKMKFSQQFDTEDKKSFNKLDDVTGALMNLRERTARHTSLSIDTNLKRRDEVEFMMDMIASDEVYLQDIASEPIRVIPSAEDLDYSAVKMSPVQFTLKLEVADSESNITPGINGSDDARKPRVFSNEFANTFK